MKTTVPDGRESPPEFRRIARAIEFVATHVRQQPTLADIAAAANWSEYHFAREFRRWTGISPKQWLQELSLAAAKQSLDDERSVLQAAIDAGLSGPGRLHDLFVTLEAVTPGEYKSRGQGMTLRFGTAPTPFGEALIVCSARGIAFLAFADEDGAFDGFEDFRATWRDAQWERDDSGAKLIRKPVWRAIPRGPIAAGMGTSIIGRGISSRNRSTSWRPRSYAKSRWMISDSASTCSPPTRMSTRVRLPGRNPARS